MTLKPGHCRSYSNAASAVENHTEPTKGERVFRLDTVHPNIRPSQPHLTMVIKHAEIGSVMAAGRPGKIGTMELPLSIAQAIYILYRNPVIP